MFVHDSYAGMGIVLFGIGFFSGGFELLKSGEMTFYLASFPSVLMSAGLSVLLFALLIFFFRRKLEITLHILTSVLTVSTSASLAFFAFLRVLIHVLTEGDSWKESIPASLVYLILPLAFAIGYWVLRRKRFKIELIAFDGLTLILFLFPFFNLLHPSADIEHLGYFSARFFAGGETTKAFFCRIPAT